MRNVLSSVQPTQKMIMHTHQRCFFSFLIQYFYLHPVSLTVWGGCFWCGLHKPHTWTALGWIGTVNVSQIPIGQHWHRTSLMWLNERKFPQLCFNISWKMSQKSGSSSWRTNSLYVLDFEIKCKTSNNINLKTKSMFMLILNGWKTVELI